MERWWLPALREVFEGRRVIVAGAVPAAWNDHVEHLRSAGVRDIMVLATGGSGVGAGPDVVTHVVEPPAGLSFMERIRFDTATLGSPPADVLDVLDRFDPAGDAVVCGSFLTEAPTLAGRPLLAWRRPEWVRLEDKTLADGIWDRARVARRPSAVVDLDDAWAVAGELDDGDGTVWAADSRDGFHGGADGTRWVRDETDARHVRDELRPRCDRVRVMPFVDGIACSIHALVDATDVAVLRPVEMVTLRRGRSLVYSGCSTFWDPPESIRRSMRDACRRVGHTLRAEVGLRGTFTIDGVVRRDGFWPTELNPRFGAGINTIAKATGDIPILLVHDLLVAGRSPGLSMPDLESTLVSHADAHREGATWRMLTAAAPSIDTRPALLDGDEWRWTDRDETADGFVSAGPGFARCGFDRARTPIGPSVGPRAAAFWRFAEPEFGIGAGDVTAAPDPFEGPSVAVTQPQRPAH